MRPKILAAMLLVCGIAATTTHAYAQESQTISATVSPLSVSLTVNPGTIDYGTMAFETSRKSTDPEAGGVTFTATNTGNAAESFLVHGDNATGDGFTWTLTDAIGCGPVTARDKFRHSVTLVGSTSSLFLLPVTEYALATGVPALTGTVQFKSEFYMPCSGSGGAGKTASTSIIVVAVSP